jgi:bacteriorhodopsin
MKDSVSHIVDSLVKEPVTYLNGATVAVSMMSFESEIKLAFYTVSILASILVSYKYWLEIKQLKKQDKDGESI